MFPDLRQHPIIAFDTETTGLNPMNGDRVFGFSISTENDDYYWDIRKTPQAIDYFNDQMAVYKGRIVCHVLSFDYRMSHASNMHFNLDQCVDTAVLACLINEHEFSYSLDMLSKKYTDFGKLGDELYNELARIFGGRATKNVQMPNLPDAPFEVVAKYAKGDTRATFELYKYQLSEIEKQNLHKIVDFESELTPLFIQAEMHGVRVDLNRAEQAVISLTSEINSLQKELNHIAGFNCNPQPSKQINKLFKPIWRDGRWWACDGTPLPVTNAGQASLAAESLRLMKHPAASIILQLRSLIKTRDTFIMGHVIESAYGDRVYPTINQVKGDDGGTGTGRLSYVSPALQQIPDRNKDVAKVVKQIFLPDEGHSWVDGDKASFEVRIFAHLVGTGDIIAAYRENPELDFHQFTSDLTGLPRNPSYGGQPNAKQLNLSMIFNQGDGATADKMGMEWTWESFIPRDSDREIVYKKAGQKAKEIINKYHSRLPGVKLLADGCKEKAESRGWIFTKKKGRHLRFPNKNLSYKASGLLIQATAADENKITWLRINNALKACCPEAKMLLNVHDSYGLSIPIGEEKRVAKEVKKAVEFNRGLKVPLILEISRPGENWWDSKSSERWM